MTSSFFDVKKRLSQRDFEHLKKVAENVGGIYETVAVLAAKEIILENDSATDPIQLILHRQKRCDFVATHTEKTINKIHRKVGFVFYLLLVGLILAVLYVLIRVLW